MQFIWFLNKGKMNKNTFLFGVIILAACVFLSAESGAQPKTRAEQIRLEFEDASCSNVLLCLNINCRWWRIIALLF